MFLFIRGLTDMRGRCTFWANLRPLCPRLLRWWSLQLNLVSLAIPTYITGENTMHTVTAAHKRQDTSEDGFGTVEFIGITVVVAIIIAGIFAFPWAKELVPGTQASVCKVTTGNSAHHADGTCAKDNKTFVQASEAQPLPDDQPKPDAAGTKDRQEIIERANSWVERGVPYSMEAYTNDPNGKQYRTDCSGFVSMAWGLDNSYSTVTLPQVAHPIPKDELQPGDILLKGGPGSEGANGHVVIFNGWTDDSHTSYYALEEAGGVGATARTISYPYDGDGSYVPFRKNGL